jgi:hypothetical protein
MMFVMRRNAGTRRARWGAVVAVCVLATIGAASRRPIARSNAAWAPLLPLTARSPFRLGTAARPFGWSTAIGDLNADGRPDYAVADRIGRGSSGFHYSVELSVSGIGARFVTFDSEDSSLSVSLRDVDHDRDLDVVVSTILSPTVVHVWLNDGRGAFAEAASIPLSPEWHPIAPVAIDSGVDQGAVAESSVRRTDDVLEAVHTREMSPARLACSSAPGSIRLIERPSFHHRSRAPPTAALLLT